MSVIDSQTQKYIGKCIVPVDNFVFGEQYNLGLLLNKEGAYLLFSISLEWNPLDEIALFNRVQNLVRLKVLLRGFEQSFVGQDTVVVAVVQLVENGDLYKRNMAKCISSVS
jgi:hypothetical protein